MIKKWFKLTEDQKENLVLIEEKNITLNFSIGLFLNTESNKYLLLTNNFRKVAHSEIVDDYAVYLRSGSETQLAAEQQFNNTVIKLKEQKYQGLFLSIVNSSFITWWYKEDNTIIFTYSMHI